MMLSEPGWLLDLLAGVMLAVSVYCAVRVVLVRRLHRTLHYDVNAAHVAMGAAMAGMLVPSLNLLPDGAWEAIFSGFAIWFAWQSASLVARRGLAGRSSDHIHGVSHYLTHLVMSGAMLYMYFAAGPATVPGAPDMAMGPAPGTADVVALPLVFILILAVSAVWHVDALNRFSPVRVAAASGGRATRVVTVTGGPSEAAWLAPRLEMACHIAMCVTMAFMLVLLL